MKIKRTIIAWGGLLLIIAVGAYVYASQQNTDGSYADAVIESGDEYATATAPMQDSVSDKDEEELIPYNEPEDIELDTVHVFEEGTYFVAKMKSVIGAGQTNKTYDDEERVVYYALKAGSQEWRAIGYIDQWVAGDRGAYLVNAPGVEDFIADWNLVSGEETNGIVLFEEDDRIEMPASNPYEERSFFSENGRYEVRWSLGEFQDGMRIISLSVLDTVSGDVVAEHDQYGTTTEGPLFVGIDNTGTYLYERATCGCAADLPGMFQVNVQTLERVDLHVPLGLKEGSQSAIDVNNGFVLAVFTETEIIPDSHGQLAHLAPSTIKLLDTETMEVTTLIESEELALEAPAFDKNNPGHYRIRAVEDPYDYYLLSFEDTEISQEHYLGTGVLQSVIGEWYGFRDVSQNQFIANNFTTKEQVSVSYPEGELSRYNEMHTVNWEN
jgi:hypothetical protein